MLFSTITPASCRVSFAPFSTSQKSSVSAPRIPSTHALSTESRYHRSSAFRPSARLCGSHHARFQHPIQSLLYLPNFSPRQNARHFHTMKIIRCHHMTGWSSSVSKFHGRQYGPFGQHVSAPFCGPCGNDLKRDQGLLGTIHLHEHGSRANFTNDRRGLA